MQSSPYSMAFDANLPALLAELGNRVKPVDPDRSWIDPLHDFAEASELIVQHYRQVSSKVTFDGVLLEKWVIGPPHSSRRAHSPIDKPAPRRRTISRHRGRSLEMVHLCSFILRPGNRIIPTSISPQTTPMTH